MEIIIGSFLEGLLSFLSPCVLPLIPLYMTYLSGEEDNNQKKTFIRTLFFVLGIFTVISLLALSLDSIKDLVSKYKDIISIVGSVILIIFGLHETGLINISILNIEARFKIDLKLKKMNIIKAYLFGFFFSLAWSPCIGPMLTSALLTSLSDSSGIINLFAYALGLTIPFLITGLFTNLILKLIKKYKKVTRYILIVSGIVLIAFGLYLGINGSNNIIKEKENLEKEIKELNISSDPLLHMDVDGKIYDLSDYEGKYIYINFTTTWCSYCKTEIPDYLEFSLKHDDIVCFYAMSYEQNGSGEEEVRKYIEDNNVQIPILIDSNNKLFGSYPIDGYPTVVVLGPDQSLIGYQAGALDAETFDYIHERVKEIYLGN